MNDLLIHPHDRVDFEEVKHAYQQFLAMRILKIINATNMHRFPSDCQLQGLHRFHTSLFCFHLQPELDGLTDVE